MDCIIRKETLRKGKSIEHDSRQKGRPGIVKHHLFALEDDNEEIMNKMDEAGSVAEKDISQGIL